MPRTKERNVNMNYDRNAKYFQKPNYGMPIGLIIVGILICVIGGRFGAMAILIALALIGIGVLLIVKGGGNRPTDAEMDAQVALPEDLVERTLDKHGITIDEVQAYEPIIWGGYYSPAEAALMGADVNVISGDEAANQVLEALKTSAKSGSLGEVFKNADAAGAQAANLAGKALLETMKGKDGLVRSSLSYQGVWLFSKTTMYTFLLVQSLTKDWRQESGEEFPYQEIRKITFEDVNGYKAARLHMVDGQIPTCIVRDEAALAAINALRQEIRDRRA